MRRLLIAFVLASCFTEPVEDVDGDGWTVDEGDCDDRDPMAHPGAEDRPGDGYDDDCDGQDATEPIDLDRDGSPEGEDCDDRDPFIAPGRPEVCNGVDDDCDDAIDEGTDADGDGALPCGATADCDDGDPDVHPGASEVCDGLDQDCDGAIDEDFDADADAVSTCGPDGVSGTADDDCDDTDPEVTPGRWDDCGDGDADCDGLVDEDADPDHDGFTECTAPVDCDPDDADSYPGAPELCDGDDNDCDGVVDDGFAADADGDGAPACFDCDDGDPARHPEALDVPQDGIDQDCDGVDQIGGCNGAVLSVNETEPNGTGGAANLVVGGPGDLRLRGRCDTAVDVDTFAVNTSCTGPLRATLSYGGGAVAYTVTTSGGTLSGNQAAPVDDVQVPSASVMTAQVTCGAGSAGGLWQLWLDWR